MAYLHELVIIHGDLKGVSATFLTHPSHHSQVKQANILVDNAGTARIADFGLMTMADLSTILISATVVSSGGTLCWISPELLDPPPGSDGCPTRESDIYALGMVIYEVGWLDPSQRPLIYQSQVLTGHRPFHHMNALKSVPAVLRGERPEKPVGAESLGFSPELWELLQLCWSEMSSGRPTARRLFDQLSPASLTWIPPSVYPAIEVSGFNTADPDSSGPLGTFLAVSTGEM